MQTTDFTRRLWLALGALGALASVQNTMHVQRVEAARGEPGEARRFLERTETVTSAILSGSHPLRMAAEHMETWRNHRRSGSAWAVECTDEHGEVAAYVLWNASTNGLMSIGRRREQSAVTAAPPMVKRDARTAALAWLRLTGIAGAGSAWHATSTVRGYDAWMVECRYQGRRALILLDSRTATLISATCSQSGDARAEGGSYR